MTKDDVLLVLDVISFVRKPLRKNSSTVIESAFLLRQQS
jgi:hypothetical protein